MTNQQIFEMLADLEEKAFYIHTAYRTEETMDAWKTAKAALEAFAKATGCHN